VFHAFTSDEAGKLDMNSRAGGSKTPIIGDVHELPLKE
jgi:hypothetical protein